MHRCSAGTCGGQKRALHALELEFSAVVSPWLGSSEEAVYSCQSLFSPNPLASISIINLWKQSVAPCDFLVCADSLTMASVGAGIRLPTRDAFVWIPASMAVVHILSLATTMLGRPWMMWSKNYLISNFIFNQCHIKFSYITIKLIKSAWFMIFPLYLVSL